MYSIHIHVYILALFLYIHTTSVGPLFFPLQPPLDKFTGTAAFLCFPLPGAIQSWHLWHCPCPCDSFKPPPVLWWPRAHLTPQWHLQVPTLGTSSCCFFQRGGNVTSGMNKELFSCSEGAVPAGPL